MARVEGLPAALLSLALFSACAPANETPKPTNGPVVREVIAAATTVPCTPEESGRINNLPTPVSVGGGAASPEEVTASKKFDNCELLSDFDRQILARLNELHPLLATPDPVRDPARQLAPASTPAPVPPELAKKPENFLPEYSVFYGQMKQENGSGTGSVIIAHIPGRSEWLYAFSMANREIGGYIFKINKLDANNLEASGGLGQVNIALEEDGKRLSGALSWKRNNTSWSFVIQNAGTGRAVTLETAKKLWAREMLNNPALWQNVSEKTILDSMFDGKGILLP